MSSFAAVELEVMCFAVVHFAVVHFAVVRLVLIQILGGVWPQIST